jgi:hypothetical protein
MRRETVSFARWSCEREDQAGGLLTERASGRPGLVGHDEKAADVMTGHARAIPVAVSEATIT